nr:PREDICTED: uncharacterized protein LOC105265259 [Fopius arisanus]
MKTMVGDDYVGAVQPTDNGTGYALLFANPDMLTELNLATIIEVDGTMKAVPTKPEATQMWIVSFRKHNQSFAAVHAYCRGARGELYEAIFKRLISLAPGLLNVELIISDFEGAVHKACRKVFPRPRLQGCWFHFIKATSEYRKVKCQLNQLGAPRQAKYLTRSLALLPPQQIALGVDAIEEIVNSFTDDFPELKRYIKYLRTQWQPKAELLSVYDSAIRTNNDSEAYNRHYTPRVGGSKVKVFPLIRNLQLIIDDESTKMSRLNKGKPISKTKKTAEYYNKDMLIMEAPSNLQSKTQHLETSERELIRQEVYCFLKKCLTPKIQDRINEEETKQFTRNDGNQTNQNRDNSGESLSLDPDDDAEYGVKPKRKRLPRLREHSFDLPKQPSVSRITAQECEDSATAITAGGASLNSGTIFEKDDEHIDHDWVVLTYLFEEGHGQHCPYTL